MSFLAEKQRQPQLKITDAFVAVTETPDGKAKLLGIRSIDQRFAFTIYLGGSADKEGFRQLDAFFYLAEEIRLYYAKIDVSYTSPNGRAIPDSETAAQLIKNTPKFDFVSADLAWGYGNATIGLHPYKGESSENTINVNIELRRTKELAFAKRDEQPRKVVG